MRFYDCRYRLGDTYLRGAENHERTVRSASASEGLLAHTLYQSRQKGEIDGSQRMHEERASEESDKARRARVEQMTNKRQQTLRRGIFNLLSKYQSFYPD